MQDLGICDNPCVHKIGPASLAAIYRFCCAFEARLGDNSCTDVVLISPPDKPSITNAVFLLGAHMIMQRGGDPVQVDQRFLCAYPWLAVHADGTQREHTEQCHQLRLIDCWEGLWRAKQLSWVSFSPGGFELSDYEHLDNPLNADLHEVVPGKFVAMRGPLSLPDGLAYEDTTSGARNFSPAHYAYILQQYDVQVVVRLCEARYDAAEWEREGLALADLPIEDCTVPPPGVVVKFLAIAEGVPGALAVHCKTGLGRTGTLIALYMMKHHGFTARQAMGWLRILRPGSVIGPQQQYLCDSEAAIHAAGERYRRRGGAAVGLRAGATVAEAAGFIAAAIAAADAKAALLSGKYSQSFSPGRDGAWGLGGPGEAGLAEQVAAAADGRSLRRAGSSGCLAAAEGGLGSGLRHV